MRRLRRAAFLTAAGLAAAGLASLGAATAQAASVGAITEFTAGLPAGSAPAVVVAGPDGNVWFNAEGTTRGIGRITPSGAITMFSAGLNAGSHPRSIAVGPEANLWFTDTGTTRAIGRITTAGSITEFSAGLNPGSKPVSIALGADGNLWFADKGTTPAIGRITPSGTITEYSAGLNAGAEPVEITPGPDGNLWFTDTGATHAIGRVTPSGTITEFSAGLPASAVPYGIAAGPNGNLWFADIGTPAIGEVTTAGAIFELAASLEGAYPDTIAPGADGNLWFGSTNRKAVIGQVTPTGTVTEFSSGLATRSFPVAIAPGPDGNMWFGDEGEQAAVGQVITGAPPALLTAPAVQGGAEGAPATCGSVAWANWAGLQPSTSLFSFDGYKWLVGGTQVATTKTYTPTAANAGQQLECAVTVTYPLLGVTTSAASPPVTVALSKPVLSAVRESASRWRVGSKLASISRRTRKPPVGMTVSFSLNAAATVTLSFTERPQGGSARHRCLARARDNAHRGPCNHAAPVGTVTLSAPSGADKVVFQGRLSRAKKLRPGSYTLTITARNGVGVSAPKSLRFTVVG